MTQDDDIVAKFVREFHSGGDNVDETRRDTSVERILADVTEMRSVLSRVNENVRSTGGLRIPINPRCFGSIQQFNLAPLDEAIAHLEVAAAAAAAAAKSNSSSATAAAATLRKIGDILSLSIDGRTEKTDGTPKEQTSTDVASTKQRITAVHPFNRPYTYLEAFAAYAPIVYRYESLSDIMAQWRADRVARRRNSIVSTSADTDDNGGGGGDGGGDDDDGYLKCILLPARGVWQSGTSQILWIVLHILAALTIERGNCYIKRMLVLLENLSFFIWCGVCSIHWTRNRGDEYFRQVANLRSEVLRNLPIDLVLLRCHNTVHANSGGGGNRGRILPLWNLANLCVDYREFAARFLLRRGDAKSTQAFRLALCQPLFRSLNIAYPDSKNIIDATTSQTESLRFLSYALAPPSAPIDAPVTAADEQIIAVNALKEYYGNQLLRKLWYDVDPSMNVPIFVMW